MNQSTISQPVRVNQSTNLALVKSVINQFLNELPRLNSVNAMSCMLSRCLGAQSAKVVPPTWDVRWDKVCKVGEVLGGAFCHDGRCLV